MNDWTSTDVDPAEIVAANHELFVSCSLSAWDLQEDHHAAWISL